MEKLYSKYNERDDMIVCPHCDKDFDASDSDTWLAIVGEFNSAIQELNIQKANIMLLNKKIVSLESHLESEIRNNPVKSYGGWPPKELDDAGSIIE